MSDSITLNIDGKAVELPIITGSEGERAIDIGKLRAQTGLVTIDPGFKNTASTLSGITFLNGEKGILRYRGYPIEQLAERSSSFLEVSWLAPVRRAADEGASSKTFREEITHAQPSSTRT